MTKRFQTRLQAIDWIANHAEDEAQFEVMREQLMFNHIYTGKYFVKVEKEEAEREIIWLR